MSSSADDTPKKKRAPAPHAADTELDLKLPSFVAEASGAAANDPAAAADPAADASAANKETLPMITLPRELIAEAGAAPGPFADGAEPPSASGQDQRETKISETLPMVTLPGSEEFEVPQVGAQESRQTRLGMGIPEELEGPEVVYTPEKLEDGAAPLVLVYSQQDRVERPAVASDSPAPMTPRDREGGIPVPLAPPTPDAPEHWLRSAIPAPPEPAAVEQATPASVPPAPSVSEQTPAAAPAAPARRRRITEKVAPLSSGRTRPLQIALLAVAVAVFVGSMLLLVLW